MSDKPLKSTRVGLNLLGMIVLFCEECHETFYKDGQSKTLDTLASLAYAHRCLPANVKHVQALREFEANRLITEAGQSGT